MKLKFGTGGLRAVMGEDDGCMNLSVIREATLGVAAYAQKKEKNPGFAIAYDTRKNSEKFAREAARILAIKGCQVYIYPKATPTPMLSFAVRELKCHFGICITASHNPKEYNGYKVYGADGCQITNNAAETIQSEIERIDKDDMHDWRTFEDFVKERKIIFISERINEAFINMIAKLQTYDKKEKELQIVYTPLNGTGLAPMLDIFKKTGVHHVRLVEEQTMPDSNFTTCPCPNPEEEKTLFLGIELCKKTNADILIATDPDSDRIGVVAKCGKEYKLLNGNQLGVLLLDYLLRYLKINQLMPQNPVVFKTIVTTSMVEKIAEEYGVQVIDTLTGFKYIGELIGKLENVGELDRFVFGVEESCGYLIGPYVRDKDAIGTAMIVCEMAEIYKEQGKTLWDRLQELYEKYGYYQCELETQKYERAEAEIKMKQLRSRLSKFETATYDGKKILRYEDYLEGLHGLPKSNVVKLWLKNGTTVVIRPSGTEPKIKVYREKCLV